MISEKDRMIMEYIHNHYFIPVVDLESELAGLRNDCKKANENIQKVIFCPSVFDIMMSAARCLIAGASETAIIQIMSSAMPKEVLSPVLGKDGEFFDFIKILYSGIFVIGDVEEHRKHSLENIGEQSNFDDTMMASMTIAATAMHMAVSDGNIDAESVKEVRANMFASWMPTNPSTEHVISVAKLKDDSAAMFAIMLDVTYRVNHGDIDIDSYNSVLDAFINHCKNLSGDDVADDLSSKLSVDALGILDKISKKVGEDNA